MFGTYKPDDVTILLKDITGLVEPLGTKEREAKIQSGVHYSEMLPLEYEPSPEYMAIYNLALDRFSGITAEAVGAVAEQIWNDKGRDTVLVSLARAGTPIGILIKRYMEKKFHCKIPHYTISIIRGRGIDKNAVDYIIARHNPQGIQFVDGWTGKGAIRSVLTEALKDYPQVAQDLAVLSDSAFASEKSGTHEDFLIASSCLNSTVSGLLSRTFLRSDIIGEKDFHGAVFYSNLAEKDVTYQFIDRIEQKFDFGRDYKSVDSGLTFAGLSEAEKIRTEFGIRSINFVKPGIGETTRVLLRRVPWKILVHSMDDETNLGHIYQLAREKNVPVEEYPLEHYKACGLIKDLSDI
ncbi:MAG: cysteine protease StiP family protein [Ruminococcus flavefaciens]|nr:cysteine protease StiP family protein [Ruminococcus flavefaciens]MCM1231074.1 cysteine protease StiP family protein [Ruminococcus flavefaciens]